MPGRQRELVCSLRHRSRIACSAAGSLRQGFFRTACPSTAVRAHRNDTGTAHGLLATLNADADHLIYHQTSSRSRFTKSTSSLNMDEREHLFAPHTSRFETFVIPVIQAGHRINHEAIEEELLVITRTEGVEKLASVLLKMNASNPRNFEIGKLIAYSIKSYIETGIELSRHRLKKPS